MRKALTLIVVLATFTSLGLAEQVSVSPSTYDLGEVYAGDTVSQQLRVSWKGDTSVVAKMMSNLEAEDTNSTGINATFSDTYLILQPGETTFTTLQVSTDPGLVPDNFTVSSRAKVEVPVEVRTETNTKTETVTKYEVVNNTAYVNPLGMTEQDIKDLLKELNKTEEDLEKKNQSVQHWKNVAENRKQTIENLEGEVDSEENQYTQLASRAQGILYWALASTAINLLLVGGMLFLFREEIRAKLKG